MDQSRNEESRQIAVYGIGSLGIYDRYLGMDILHMGRRRGKDRFPDLHMDGYIHRHPYPKPGIFKFS